MDSDRPPPVQRCGCACHSDAPPAVWSRSVKRRLEEAAHEPSSISPVPGEGEDEVVVSARVEMDDEVAALREALASHQQTVQELCAELDEERSASATAASEAMSMILRLQREKAEVQMEARQFKRFAEEKMAHDQQELADLDELLFRREQSLQTLSLQLQSYNHPLINLGINPDDLLPEDPWTPQNNTVLPPFEYPPLRCTLPADLESNDGNGNHSDIGMDTETPHIHEDTQNIETRIYNLECTSTASHINIMEKDMIDRTAAPEPLHIHPLHNVSCNGSSSLITKKPDLFPLQFDHPTENEYEVDDGNDRIYTIDAVHKPKVEAHGYDTMDPQSNKEHLAGGEEWDDDGGIKKLLYARLQALEADRESMRQAIISMQTEKAQLVLLREIAQQLCKDARTNPQKCVVKKQPSLTWKLSLISAIKWILSFIFWRKKASRCRYTFGQSRNNAGLLLILDKSPCLGMGLRFCVPRRF